MPDLYLKLPGGELIPQDPQVMRFAKPAAAKCSRRPSIAAIAAISARRSCGAQLGKGSVIYIGSGLEAIYAETRMQSACATSLGSLIDPVLAAQRTYEVEHQSGLMPQLMASRDTLLLHLLADTGNKNKHLRIREEFLPVPTSRCASACPDGRTRCAPYR